ncbi:Holliday junction branch migration protein RuvA [Filimonas effusa]|uniref:Holliday junction branch migration complex subunit RuvA n=1 Tax=Filimonas effusa TaxID=2508721 RepID=A0A4Q1D0V1_9BACT|nr:Holliday junction branch migration protein RuvA [Filimonas effusa]RXK81396.1 Holliday junction branch migration protein RuvA [Filimonas effusa]
MIAFVRGLFVNKTPAQVIVDVNGVGYDLHISLNTYSAIANMEKGQLLTYLHITENGQTLYGFYEQLEKELFLQLISVSGVGASTARMMLSGMKPDEIVRAIVQGNAKQLEGIKGIGKKTAERLILELRDKMNKQSLETTLLPGITPQHSIENDAVNALVSLGIARPMAEQALKKALKSHPLSETTSLEELIKLALKNI